MGSDDPENYPVLGRYFDKPFFEDKEWWDKSFEIFTKDEHDYLNRQLWNPFQPDFLLFADGSNNSLSSFGRLLALGIKFRTLPLDDYVTTPSLGWIGMDTLITGHKEVGKYIKVLQSTQGELKILAEDMRSVVNKMLKDMEPVERSALRKTRLISIDRAIEEMARIQEKNND